MGSLPRVHPTPRPGPWMAHRCRANDPRAPPRAARAALPVGIAKTDDRERSSIFSATAGILAAYNADAPRQAAAEPNFDADQFATSTDTVYITAPAHKQDRKST